MIINKVLLGGGGTYICKDSFKILPFPYNDKGVKQPFVSGEEDRHLLKVQSALLFFICDSHIDDPLPLAPTGKDRHHTRFQNKLFLC